MKGIQKKGKRETLELRAEIFVKRRKKHIYIDTT